MSLIYIFVFYNNVHSVQGLWATQNRSKRPSLGGYVVKTKVKFIESLFQKAMVRKFSSDSNVCINSWPSTIPFLTDIIAFI